MNSVHNIALTMRAPTTAVIAMNVSMAIMEQLAMRHVRQLARVTFAIKIWVTAVMVAKVILWVIGVMVASAVNTAILVTKIAL